MTSAAFSLLNIFTFYLLTVIFLVTILSKILGGYPFMSIDLEDRGHALENEYFHRKEQELIQKMKAHMAVENAKATAMKCPKCEGTLMEADYDHIKIDICDKCHGAWFDAGELTQVIEKDKQGGWFGRLFG